MARTNMKAMVIRSGMWVTEEITKMGKGAIIVKMSCPTTCYTLCTKELHKFYECLYCVKVSSGELASIRKLVDMKTHRLIGMNAHDYHVMIT